MAKMNDISRRALLRGSLAGVATAGLPGWFVHRTVAAELERAAAQPRRTIGPNDAIVIGGIGMGGSKGGFRQGLGDTRSASRHPGTKVVAVCDVDQTHRDEAAKAFGPDTKGYTDFRELLERRDIDAVVIGTPDHWHAIQAIQAMRKGKDVYCEKPLTLTVDEGRKIVQAQKETGAIFQTGSQQRSDARFRLACELVRNGRIGKVRRVEARLPGGAAGGPFETLPVPPDFDWNFWLGPAPLDEYVRERTHGSFRHWYEYSGGMMTDWGAHHLDITQWGLGMDESGPVAVEGKATWPAQSRYGYNTPLQFDVTYAYPGDITVVATSRGENGVRFEGESGWIFVSRGKIEASDPALLKDPLPDSATKLYASNDHMGNWLDGIRTRKAPICDAVVGHRSASVCHIGNIALRLGRKLQWDPAQEQFVNDGEANKMLRRPYRKPWNMYQEI